MSFVYKPGVTFEQMDENDPHTRSALTRLLLSAETGMPVNSDMLIEALPLEGGCLLLITPLGKSHCVRPKKAEGPYIYAIADGYVSRVTVGLSDIAA